MDEMTIVVNLAEAMLWLQRVAAIFGILTGLLLLMSYLEDTKGAIGKFFEDMLDYIPDDVRGFIVAVTMGIQLIIWIIEIIKWI